MKVAVVLPRNMNFTEFGATSIDLIVKDQIQGSAYSNSSIVVGTEIQNPFDEVDYRGVAGHTQRRLNLAYLEAIQRFSPSIIVVHQFPKTASLLAKKFPTIPVILYRHGLTKPRSGRFSRFRKIHQYKPISKFIFVSNFIKSEFLKDFPSLNSKCAVLGNAIDTEQWKPAAIKENKICYVGRALVEKGIIELIQGFKKLNFPNWTLDLIVTVSTTREKRFFQQIQQEIGESKQINLQANLTTHEVREQLSLSKIATLPSIVKEGFPRSVVEAMSCGCATIASTSGGTPEVTGSAAIMLDNVTPDTISHALNSLISEPNKLQSWSEKARNHAKLHLGLNTHIKKYDAILASCVID